MGKRQDVVMNERHIAQAGAVPFRRDPAAGDGGPSGADGLQVLLVKSRAGQWILPKGHIEANQSPEETARREAWEEAGVQGQIVENSLLGTYEYEKLGSSYRVELFALRVTRTMEDWPERGERERLWVPLAEARKKVAYPELRAALDKLVRLLNG
jgi:8-oxo-dGTP pyrophosphatase MutT (NUDIX family)